MSKIAITGASGLVGQLLVPTLTAQGHDVLRIGRSLATSDVVWNPAQRELDAVALEGCDAVVHLAGENIAGRRWTKAYKARIRESRIQGTTLLCETLAKLERKPPVLVAASAIGFYGDRGDYVCDEDASCGRGFLPEVCNAWEAATEPALRAGIRVVNLRIGVVLSRHGGALQKMLLPFKLGLGGIIGNGRQFLSWISRHDLIRSMIHCLEMPSLHGPVNAVAPQAATNYEFTKTLGRVLHRPTILPMPAFAARLAFGEMANDLLLASTNVVPRRLLEGNFPFEYATLDAALRHELAL